MGRLRVNRRVTRLDLTDTGVRTSVRPDTLAVEEPLELRLGGESLVVTMRLPGHDVELAHGWLHAEGFITSRDDVVTAEYCAGSVTGEQGTQVNTYNLLDLTLRRPALLPVPELLRDQPSPAVSTSTQPGRRHAFTATSSCGICGTASLDDLARRSRFDLTQDATVVTPEVVLTLPATLATAQPLFSRTGTVHAAGLFTPTGELLVAREDVGRHNAVDKVVGWALLADRLPLSGTVLAVTSRASFEIVQKAELAGIPVVATVSGATSLAVEAAERAGITLVGFVRGNRATIYTHPHRLAGGGGRE